MPPGFEDFFFFFSMKAELCNRKLYHLILKHVKSKATRHCFPDKLKRLLRSLDVFSFSYGAFASLFPLRGVWSGDRGVIVTYPCQHDGPEGYDSPASERLAHRAQAEALQANKSTMAHTHIHATLKQTDKLAKEILLNVYFLFPLHEFFITPVVKDSNQNLNISSKHPQNRPTPIRNTKSQDTNFYSANSPALRQSFTLQPTKSKGFPVEPQLIRPSPKPSE